MHSYELFYANMCIIYYYLLILYHIMVYSSYRAYFYSC